MTPTEVRHRRWGDLLTPARKAAGFDTQQAFAAKLGVSQQAVSSWERGLAAPADDLKVRIATIVGVDPHALFPLEVAS